MSIGSIYAGEGAQTVDLYPVDAAGRLALASGVDVQIVDLEIAEGEDDRVILAETTATLDATDTVVTASAGPREVDARRIVVTSAAGITPGRRYALVNGSAIEAVEVDRVEGLNVYATAPLAGTWAATATSLKGLRWSATFPAIVADDADVLEASGLYGVDWTIAGVTGPARVRTLVRVVRRGKLPRASRWDVLRIDPQLQQAQHARGSLDALLAHADGEIDALLLHHGHDLAGTSHGEVARIAVCWRAVELAYRSLEGDGHADRATAAGTEALRWRDLLLSGRKAADHVETARPTDAVRPTRRRLGRLG